MEQKPGSPKNFADLTPQTLEAGFGKDSVHAGAKRRQEIFEQLERDKAREPIPGTSPHITTKPHAGMLEVVLRDREAHGITDPTDPHYPILGTSEIIRAIAKRIERPRIDPNAPNTPMKKQDTGWAGYKAEVLKLGQKDEEGKDIYVPNHLRPTNFRQKWAARRMQYAFSRYRRYEGQALYMRRLYGTKEPVPEFIKNANPATGNYHDRTRESLSGIKQRNPHRKLGLFERYHEWKVDTRLRWIDMRARMKKRKFDKIASGKWWAI